MGRREGVKMCEKAEGAAMVVKEGKKRVWEEER